MTCVKMFLPQSNTKIKQKGILTDKNYIDLVDLYENYDI